MAVNSTFTTLGASNHTDETREKNDYYATDPIAARLLLELEPNLNIVMEPACGEGHLSKELLKECKEVFSIDIIDRGYGTQKSFFDIPAWRGDIVTNPPFKLAQEFIEHSIKITQKGARICMFLKVQFLEGIKRSGMFKKFPPKRVWVSSKRIQTAKNGEFERMKKGGGSAIAYAWFVWENGYQGETTLKWFNSGKKGGENNV